MAFLKCQNLPDHYTVIDFETTGLSPRSCEIIELAAIRVRNNMLVDRYQMLVKPQMSLDPFITRLTGISDKMLETAPPITEVLPDFLAFLGSDVLMGHNINFDLGFLKAVAPDFEARYIDTMQISRRVAREYPRHRLQDLCSRYGVRNNSAHRAMGDCMATWQCYLKLKEASV